MRIFIQRRESLDPAATFARKALREGSMEIKINEDKVEAAAGDNLLALARRKGSHVWFLCDGRGLCQTCECRVLSGAECLSPPSRIETESMSHSRRDKGYRLACQSRIAGVGPIEVLSVAEEVRRQATALINKAEGDTWMGNAGRLANTLMRFALEFTRSAPSVALHTVPQIASMPPSLSGIGRYLRDTSRVVERVLRDVRAME